MKADHCLRNQLYPRNLREIIIINLHASGISAKKVSQSAQSFRKASKVFAVFAVPSALCDTKKANKVFVNIV